MTGTELLNLYRAPLHRLAVLMAVDKYGNVPDVADRVGEARLALAQAARDWVPTPKRKGIGYFVRYVLGQVAGGIRHGAGYARETSAAETSFVDMSEVAIGRLEALSTLGNEALWRLNNDTIVSTPEAIARVMADPKRIEVALARLHDEGIEATEEELPVLLLHALTELEEREMAPAPPWTITPQNSGPVAQDLGPVTVTRRHRDGSVTTETIEGDMYTELVNEASRNSVVWDDESMRVVYDDREEAPRSDLNPAADNLEPEQCISPRLWAQIVHVFSGGNAENKENAVEALEVYWEQLDPDDSSKRKALYALAEGIVSEDWDNTWKWGGVTPATRVYGVLRRMLELETPGGWEPPELPGLSTLRSPAEEWVSKLEKSCWPSQAAGIKALAFNRASPSEARVVEQEAYAASRY